jgi:hypothetical protein
MKRVPPQRLQEKVEFYMRRYWIRAISIMLWLATVGFLAYLWSAQPAAEALITQCYTTVSVKKGEYLDLKKVKAKQIRVNDAGENAINNCSDAQLSQIPLRVDLQAGDLLQVSAFQKPEELRQLKDSLPESQHLFYLPVKDLHVLPFPVEVGQELSLVGKSSTSIAWVSHFPKPIHFP